MARKSRKNIQQMKIDIKKEIYKVGAYVRLSRLDSNKKDIDTIQNQKNIILDYIKDKEQFKLIDIYEDTNKTGTNFNRDNFERLLEDVRKGKINCIIVKDLSRFGRNYIECGNYLEKIFPFMNVRFIAINDFYDSLKEDASQILLLHLKNIVNEVYAKDISKKITTALREKKKKGNFTGSFASYGYLKDPSDKNKIIINKETQNVVKEIFSLRLKGYSYNKIAIILNKKGILSPYAYLYSIGALKTEKFKSTKWNDNNIKAILKNEIYIGNMVQGRKKNEMFGKQKHLDKEKWIIVHNTHKPIISKEIFYKVQEINNNKKKIYLQNNSKKVNIIDSENMFKSIIKCGKCEKRLVRKRERNNRANFMCRNYMIKECSFAGIKEDVLKEIVLNEIKNQISLNLNLEKILCNNVKIIELERENLIFNIKKLDEKIEKTKNFNILIYEYYLKGMLSKEEYIYNKNTNLEKIQSLLNKNEILKKNLENIKDNMDKKNNILNFQYEDILKGELIKILIEEINVYTDKSIEIKFNCRKNFKC